MTRPRWARENVSAFLSRVWEPKPEAVGPWPWHARSIQKEWLFPSVVAPEAPTPELPIEDDMLVQCLPGPRTDTPERRYRKVPKAATITNFEGIPVWCTGEIQKGMGRRGRDRKCHKLSWRLSQIVVTVYDDLWRYITFYDVLCHWNKETEIVIKCCKLS